MVITKGFMSVTKLLVSSACWHGYDSFLDIDLFHGKWHLQGFIENFMHTMIVLCTVLRQNLSIKCAS